MPGNIPYGLLGARGVDFVILTTLRLLTETCSLWPVPQLRVQISNLKGELEGRCSEMAMLETLLQRHERENQEGCHLLAMLRADLSVAAEDR